MADVQVAAADAAAGASELQLGSDRRLEGYSEI
eukprot:SAG31_NODE_2153_length_6310_cov_2.332261_8_plen_33_part_00